MCDVTCFYKDSQRSARDQIPSWIEQDRVWAVASLKVCIMWSVEFRFKELWFWQIAIWM